MHSLWILLWLTGVAGDPAGAERCRLCAAQSMGSASEEAKAISLQVETGLDFGGLILTGDLGGTARIGADGSRSSSGALSSFDGRAMVGTVVIRGEPGRAVRVEVPDRIELFGRNGSSLTLRNVTTDLRGAPRLDASGRLMMRFGGELTVNGNAEGEYRGDIPITADYF